MSSLRAEYENTPSDVLHARFQRDHLQSSTSLRTFPADRHDPIFTPLFTALFTSIGFSAGAASIAATIATALVTTAISIGIQMLLAPKPPKAEDGKVPLTQPIPYRLWGVGRYRTGGARMLWEAKGNTLMSVQAIAGHRVRSINRYYLHEDEVQLDSNNHVIALPNNRYDMKSFFIDKRLGLFPETAYSRIVAKLGAEGLWTTSHRGDGQASVAFITNSSTAEHFSSRFPFGAPQLSVEVDGARVWDYRDPSQSATDPGTWQWSRNSALIIAWHLCFNEFGYNLDYRKAILPVMDLWKEEADICDEDVATAAGGTEKRYQCSGFDTTENGPKAGLTAMLSTCDGHLVARGDGARILTVGKFRESRCVTLTDADLIGHRLEYDVLFEDEINRLVPKFTYPDTQYTTSDTDYFEDTVAQLSAGRILSEEANYQWVTSWRQARRLGKRDWLRLQQRVKGSVDVRLSGVNAVYSRWVRLNAPARLPRLHGKVVENRHSVLAITRGGFSMDIVKHPEDIDDWNAVADEGQQPPVPPAPNLVNMDTPVINLVQPRASSGSVYIRVIVIDPDDEGLTLTVRYRLADAGTGTPGAWVEQKSSDAEPSGGYLSADTGVVPADKALEVQAAFISAKGQYSNWSTTVDVVSTADPSAPGTPTNMSSVNSGGTVTVSAKAANDNTKSLVFKRGTTSQSFAAATLIGRFTVTANQTISLPDIPGTGTWKYWSGAENGSGVASSAQASSTVTV